MSSVSRSSEQNCCIRNVRFTPNLMPKNIPYQHLPGQEGWEGGGGEYSN